MTPARPLPVADPASAGYWEAAARHELALARCARCSGLVHPPDVVCPLCGSTDPGFGYSVVSGDGEVRSWTVLHQSFLPGLAGDVPFVLVDVELDVQPDLRLIGRLVDGPGAPVGPGVRVELAFEDVAPGVAVPAFALKPTG